MDDPELLTAQEGTFLVDSDLVLGLELTGLDRAYPVAMIWYHQIVNDIIGGRPILSTY